MSDYLKLVDQESEVKAYLAIFCFSDYTFLYYLNIFFLESGCITFTLPTENHNLRGILH